MDEDRILWRMQMEGMRRTGLGATLTQVKTSPPSGGKLNAKSKARDDLGAFDICIAPDQTGRRL